MSLAIATAKTLNRIKSDETLLSWARYSIRYNTGRANQTNDFISKLQFNGVDFGMVVDARAIAAALGKIEKEDKAGI